MKETFGYILIGAGILWSFGRLYVDLVKARKAPDDAKIQTLKDWVELVKTPYGPGVAMILIGALLLGVSVDLSST